MYKQVFLTVLIFLILAECSRSSRRNATVSKKESHLKMGRSVRPRGDVMENLFNIYDPSFLSVVWPKITNGVHIIVSHNCWDDLEVLYKDLADGQLWAYKVVDASGRYQSGVFTGHRYWLGSKEQCFQLDSDAKIDANVVHNEKYISGGQYDWDTVAQQDTRPLAIDVTVHPRHRLTYTAAEVLLNVIKPHVAQTFDITIGLCLPRTCTPDDVASLLTFSTMLNDNLKTNKTIPRVVKLASLRQVTDHYNFHTDYEAVILLCITLFLLTLAIAATVMEVNVIKCRRGSRLASFDVQKYNNTDTASRSLDRTMMKHTEYKELNKLNETLSVNNLNSGHNISLVAVKNVNANLVAPPITLDVVPVERVTGSCKRCGKYRRQCKSPKQIDNLPACPRVKYSSVASLTTEEKKTSFMKRLLLCFSLKYCLSRIFNTNMANKDLAMIHLLKIVATFWAIFIHVAVIVGYATVNAGIINESDNIYYILATGTLAFDMLFFVSGLFSSHHFFYLKSHYTVEELVSFGGFCGQVLQYVCFVTNRAIRLLPSYVYAVFLSSVLARVSRSTSALIIPDGDHVNCDKYWWRNLLYISTFYSSDEQCMQISWYMSTESQLHVAGAMLCAVCAGRRGRAIAALVLAGLLATTAADLTDAYNEYTRHMPGVYSAYSAVIERPWARVVPYFIGVVAGWLLFKTEGTLKISKMTSLWLWSLSGTMLMISIVLPWAAPAWAAAWLHLSFPGALLWPALACSTHYVATFRRILDSSTLAALSRLCYGALLLHGAVARVLLLNTDTALCSHALCIWSYFAGTTLLTVLGALLLSLLVEMPFCTLLRRVSDYANT